MTEIIKNRKHETGNIMIVILPGEKALARGTI